MLRLLGIGVAAAFVAVACSGSEGEPVGLARVERQPATSTTARPSTTTTAPRPRPDVQRVALSSFESCEALLADIKADAMEVVGPWGLAVHGWGRGGVAVDAAASRERAGAVSGGDEAVAAAPASGQAAEGGAPAFSSTNVQEEGVDEPDLVKTDGTRILALAGNKLQHVLLEPGGPRLAATLTIADGWPQDMLLAGDRVLVLGQTDRPVAGAPRAAEEAEAAEEDAAGSPPQYYSPSAAIWVVELGDGGSMRTVDVLRMQGAYLSARMVEGIVRIVLASAPQGPVFSYPEDDSPEAQAEATQRNRDIIAGSSVEDWLPSYVLEDHRGAQPAVAETGKLCGCRDTMQPNEPSGFGTLTVLTVDPADPRPDNAVSVMADGQIVYASTTGLYVATNQWGTTGASSTQLHKFDISDPQRAEYRASGQVPGQVINQWALSEHQGHLRVATTVFEAEGGSESLVTVLAEHDGALAAVGRVGDLGRGEQIYAVRYLGDLGYVVTFRQTDPLYVLDLSDPTQPAVRGELKILGYSAYLHPIGDGLLLGIGQDATEEGLRQGSQVSVFDVSDPAQPRRLHQVALGPRDTYSVAEFDHRAFLYWSPAATAVLPMYAWNEDGGERLEAVALRVGGGGIGEAGRVTHQGRPTQSPGGHPMIQRSLVVGDTLYTVSTTGLLASDLASLADRAWVRF